MDLGEKNAIVAPEELESAEALSVWAVKWRYDDENTPALDRRRTLALLEPLRTGPDKRLRTSPTHLRPSKSNHPSASLRAAVRQRRPGPGPRTSLWASSRSSRCLLRGSSQFSRTVDAISPGGCQASARHP